MVNERHIIDWRSRWYDRHPVLGPLTAEDWTMREVERMISRLQDARTSAYLAAVVEAGHPIRYTAHDPRDVRFEEQGGEITKAWVRDA